VPSPCSDVNGTDNVSHASSSSEVNSTVQFDAPARILLECCSDDVMESLVARSDNMNF
jgi:hypothetical protein